VTAEAAIFICSICGEPAGEICVYCTKDACSNHRCDRCKRCSDCCECEIPLSAAEAPAAVEVEASAAESQAEVHPVEAPQVDAEPESQREPEPSEEMPPPRHENPIF